MSIKKDILSEEYLAELSEELHSVGQKATAEKNHIKIILYPSLIAFVVLAAYAFFLIQSLTTDVNSMSASLLNMTESVSNNMDTLSATTIEINQSMDKMLENISSMSQSAQGISSDMDNMTQNVAALQTPMDDMNRSTQYMKLDIHGLNQSFSKPLGMFNQFLPWTNP